jgi:uncharacterized protein (UPF0248 family)
MFRSKHPRDLFNEIKWRFDLSRCKIYYIHRGVPGDVKIVEGSDIKKIDRSFLVLEGVVDGVYIPYHRILRIDYDDQVIFERTKRNLEHCSSGYYNRK